MIKLRLILWIGVFSLISFSTVFAQGGDYQLDFDLQQPATDAYCLNESGQIIDLGNHYSKAYRTSPSNDTAFDARNTTFFSSTYYPVQLNGGTCWVGGTIVGDFDPNGGWHYFKKPNRTGFLWKNDSKPSKPVVVDGIRIDNHQDGIRFSNNIGYFIVRNAYTTRINDDCIENDQLWGGLVEDSLFDGCYVGFSARLGKNNKGKLDGSDNIWRIQDSLIYMKPMNKPFRGDSPGHGPTFKWEGGNVSPQLSLHNNIFLFEKAANHGNTLLEKGYVIESCANNIVVWLGQGPFPGGLGVDPNTGNPCFTVTTDKSVWDNAKNSWLQSHGYDTDYTNPSPTPTAPSVPAPVPTPTPTPNTIPTEMLDQKSYVPVCHRFS